MDLNVLHNISYGMFVVSSNKGDSLNGQIANTVFQITSKPVIIAVSISKKNLTHEYIESSQRFSVSVLSEDTPLKFIGLFGFKSGRDIDKFKDAQFKKLSSGCPVALDNATCYMEARVIKEMDCTTHTLFLGEVTQSQILKDSKPMTYDYYHQVKRGATPENAPTFIKDETNPALADVDFSFSKGGVKKEGTDMKKYRCTVCNYIYDQAIGDPDGSIAPGTPFEKIPDTWVCPVCGASKSEFVMES